MSKTGHKKPEYPKTPRLKPIKKDRFQNGKIEVPDEGDEDIPNIWDWDDDETDGSDETPEGSVLKGIYEQDRRAGEDQVVQRTEKS